jgi:hypothetical protein
MALDDKTMEILQPDPNLGDDVKLFPSTLVPGKDAAVAMKNGNAVCWCCFDPLGHNFIDLVMGEALVRFCTKKSCLKKVAQRNAGREQEHWNKATKIITSG